MFAPESMKGDRAVNPLAIRALGLTALLALAVTSAWAGSDGRKGTSGAMELMIPVGARGSALGASTASDVTGAEATFWNPAGLGSVEGTDALFSHTTYFADMKVNYVAAAMRAGALGALGFSAKVLSVGDVVVTTEQSPDGTGEILHPTFSVLGVSWAREFTDRVSFGGTANFVNENLASVSANGLAFDFGVQYKTGWRGLQFGMTMKNFGNAMSFNGQNLEFPALPPGSEPGAANRVVRLTTAAFELPSYFSLSGTYDAWRQGNSALKLRSAFQNNNFSGDNLSGAAEWTYKENYALRGSWFGTMNSSTDVITGIDQMSFSSGDDLYQGFALGGSAMVKNGVATMGLDVAWRPAREFFDDTYEVTLRVRF
jgi:hypothetical protein